MYQSDATTPALEEKDVQQAPRLNFAQYSSHNQVGVGVFIKEMTDHNISFIGLNRNATTILQITP